MAHLRPEIPGAPCIHVTSTTLPTMSTLSSSSSWYPLQICSGYRLGVPTALCKFCRRSRRHYGRLHRSLLEEIPATRVCTGLEGHQARLTTAPVTVGQKQCSKPRLFRM